ncbi:MAG TPA: hypothetical protein VHX38_08710 [Pseudonocardiaceae bacterium]|jgi:hypothetical protein|nr:hypothetical protein [Pseudonocardiaceae bacterium]
MIRRLAPAAFLLLCSPLIIEFLAGSTTLSAPWAILGFATLNGAGALLIRELWVRRGHGRGSGVVLVALAIAYGLLEEGILDQSLFNPNAYGGNWLSFGWFPALGTSIPVGSYEIGITALGSVIVPIGLTDLVFPAHREQPLLGRTGLIVTAAVFALFGCGSTVATTVWVTHGVAGRPQLLGAGALVAALIALARLWPVTAGPAAPDRAVPPALAATVFSALVTGASIELIHDDHRGWWSPTAATTALVLLAIAGIVVVSRWMTSADWNPLRQLGLLSGAVLAIAGLGLILRVGDTPVHAIEQICLTLATVVALTALARQLAKPNRTPTPETCQARQVSGLPPL